MLLFWGAVLTWSNICSFKVEEQENNPFCSFPFPAALPGQVNWGFLLRKERQELVKVLVLFQPRLVSLQMAPYTLNIHAINLCEANCGVCKSHLKTALGCAALRVKSLWQRLPFVLCLYSKEHSRQDSRAGWKGHRIPLAPTQSK